MFVLKYPTGEFVGEDSASGGYPYPTKHLYNAKMFQDRNIAQKYLEEFSREFPTEKIDYRIYTISVS
jgi:hypothetical protein